MGSNANCAIHGCRLRAVEKGLCAEHAGDVFLAQHHFDNGKTTKQFEPRKLRIAPKWIGNTRPRHGRYSYLDVKAYERGRAEIPEPVRKWEGILDTCRDLPLGGSFSFCFTDRSKSPSVLRNNFRSMLSSVATWRFEIKRDGEAFTVKNIGTWDFIDEVSFPKPLTDAEVQIGELIDVYRKQKEEAERNMENLQKTLGLLAIQDVAFRCEYFSVTHKRITEFEMAFPDVDPMAELMKMKIWLDANPTKHKENYPRFINGWLNRAQSRVNAEDRKNELEQRSEKPSKEQSRAERSQRAIENAFGHRSGLVDALRSGVSGGDHGGNGASLPRGVEGNRASSPTSRLFASGSKESFPPDSSGDS